MSKIIFPKIDLTGIKGVLIDIDNTLYPYEVTHQKAIKTCYDTFAKDFISQLSFDDFNMQYRQKRNEVIKRLEPQGTCRSRMFAFQALFEEMNLPQAFNAALDFENLYWDTFIESMKLCEDALLFLKRCQEREIRICAISDMQARFQVRKLQSLGVDHLIDFLVTSEEVGSEKPASIIFQIAFKKLDLKLDTLLMIGDNEEKDIKAAESIGIRGIKIKVSDK